MCCPSYLINACVLRCSKCQGHHCTGNNQVPSIKTSSSVVEVVKLMPWRQAKSPLKIPSWSGGKMSSSYIFYNWHPPDQEGNFKGEVACLQGINLTTSNTEDDVFMDGTWLLPVQWCPWHLVNTWNTLMSKYLCILFSINVEKLKQHYSWEKIFYHQILLLLKCIKIKIILLCYAKFLESLKYSLNSVECFPTPMLTLSIHKMGNYKWS